MTIKHPTKEGIFVFWLRQVGPCIGKFNGDHLFTVARLVIAPSANPGQNQMLVVGPLHPYSGSGFWERIELDDLIGSLMVPIDGLRNAYIEATTGIRIAKPAIIPPGGGNVRPIKP